MHAEIEEEHRRVHASDDLDAGDAVVGFEDFVALGAEVFGERPADELLVVADNDFPFLCHVRSPAGQSVSRGTAEGADLIGGVLFATFVPKPPRGIERSKCRARA